MTSPDGAGNAGGGGADVQYALELYLPRFGRDALPEAAARAGAAAEQLRGLGTPVRFLRSIFLPGDEICFLLFEGPSSEAVAETGRRAAIAFERVVEVEIAHDEGSQAVAGRRPGRKERSRKAREAGPSSVSL